MKNIIITLSLISTCLTAQKTDTLKITTSDNWWTGIVGLGQAMPLSGSFEANTYGKGYANQVQPLLLSDRGDVIWSEAPLHIVKKGNELSVISHDKIIHTATNATLKEAVQYAGKNYFPPSGKMPDETLFAAPQYNTWIELMYDQNEKDILKYARAIIENNYPPGVLMIDDNWQEDYGKWNFHPGRFSAPKEMIDELHSLGFKVMMWVCPFVSPDCDVFRALDKQGLFMKTKDGKTAIIRWWNGASAVLDLSNPAAKEWFRGQLQGLVDDYGVDGFKLDAGDARFYTGNVDLGGLTPNEHSKLYGEIGLDFPLNEYRAMWKMGGQPLAQRLNDKNHSWKHLRMLIPQMLVESLVGYPFSCPDLIGGGQYASFLDGAVIDQELIVRSAQCHALMPMMQFSVAPWRILDEKHHAAVKKAIATRQKHKDYILTLAREAAQSGEPIISPMEYHFPQQDFSHIKDQFMLGKHFLVAPVLEKGTHKRHVILPKGKWKTPEGKIIKGGKKIEFEVTLDELLYFERL